MKNYTDVRNVTIKACGTNNSSVCKKYNSVIGYYDIPKINNFENDSNSFIFCNASDDLIQTLFEFDCDTKNTSAMKNNNATSVSVKCDKSNLRLTDLSGYDKSGVSIVKDDAVTGLFYENKKIDTNFSVTYQNI